MYDIRYPFEKLTTNDNIYCAIIGSTLWIKWYDNVISLDSDLNSINRTTLPKYIRLFLYYLDKYTLHAFLEYLIQNNFVFLFDFQNLQGFIANESCQCLFKNNTATINSYLPAMFMFYHKFHTRKVHKKIFYNHRSDINLFNRFFKQLRS